MVNMEAESNLFFHCKILYVLLVSLTVLVSWKANHDITQKNKGNSRKIFWGTGRVPRPWHFEIKQWCTFRNTDLEGRQSRTIVLYWDYYQRDNWMPVKESCCIKFLPAFLFESIWSGQNIPGINTEAVIQKLNPKKHLKECWNTRKFTISFESLTFKCPTGKGDCWEQPI